MLEVKMRRFAVSYLTVSVIIIVLANLTLVLFYVRQFSLRASSLADCLSKSCPQVGTLRDFVAVNSILVGLLLIIWFAVNKFHFHHPTDR